MKGKNFCLAFLPPILILGIQSLVSMIAVGITFLGSAVKSGSPQTYQSYLSKISFGNLEAISLLVYSIIAIAVFAPWWAKKRVAFESRRMSFRGFKPFRLILGIVLFVIGAQIVCSFLLNFLGAAFPGELDRYSKLMKEAGLDLSGITPAMVIYSAVLGPIAEELAFRGLTLGYFKKALPSFALANIFQALLFGLIHMNFLQGAYAFVVGLLLGYVAHKTGSLLLSMVLHICFNSSSFILETVSPKFINSGAFCAFAVLVLSMMAVYVAIVLLISSQPMAKEK
ncbi:MAG: lysostaphin resistance A-like protein [Candidatus Weimeria sp.]